MVMQQTSLLTRAATWQRATADGLVLYFDFHTCLCRILLPNRRCLENEIGAALERTGGNFSVLLAGLARLQSIYNLHGHAGGDAVLSQVAARLRQEVGRIGFLARTGDDEFAVLISGQEADRATRVALSLVQNINPPVQIATRQHKVGAHVGIAQVTSENRNIGDVLRRAHIALDRAR